MSPILEGEAGGSVGTSTVIEVTNRSPLVVASQRKVVVEVGRVGPQGPTGPPGSVSGWIFAEDYGVTADGTTDDSSAVEDAIDAALALKTGFATRIIYPPGNIRITRDVFSHTPTDTNYPPPIHEGAGWLSTFFLLDPPTAADAWMYDSSPDGNEAAYGGLQFEQVGFGSMGANAAFANGFRYYSEGQEQKFTWKNCAIAIYSTLKTWLYACGTGNGDQTMHFNCLFGECTDSILKLNGLQAIDHDFIGCKAVDIVGNLVTILDETDDPTFGLGGGGQVNWVGGIIEQKLADQSRTRYLIDAAGSSNLATSIRLRPNQMELQNSEGRILRKTGLNGVLNVTIEQAKFDSIASDGTDYTVVDIAPGTNLIFRDCTIRSNMVFDIDQTLGAAGFSLAEPGSVVWENCTIPQDLSKRCEFDGAAYLGAASQVGYFSARKCRFPVGTGDAFNTTYGTYYFAADFDIGWQFANHGPTFPVKLASMHHDSHAWPRTSGEEASVVLPYNCVIVGFVIYKPATGADTGAHQYSVGPNDRSIVYAASALAQWKDAHLINVDLPPNLWAYVGTSENLRKVELWASTASGTGDQSPSNSVALVKYI